MLNDIKSDEIDMNKVCRTCLATGELISIFNPCATGPCILQKLTSVTSKKYYDCFGLPTQVCNVCVYEINRAYKFASKCHETDRKLRDYIRQTNATSETDSATISKVVGHLEKVSFDLTDNRNKWIDSINQRFKKQKLNSQQFTNAVQRSIHVTINYDSDESDFAEIHNFPRVYENNQIAHFKHNNQPEYDYSHCSKSEVNLKRKIVERVLESDVKIELTSEVDLGISESSNHSNENVLNPDTELQIKTEICANKSDDSLANKEIKYNLEPECSLTSNVLNTSEVSNEINQSDNQNSASLHFKSTIPTSALELPINNQIETNRNQHLTLPKNITNAEQQITPNQEFDLKQLNIENQVIPNQQSDLGHLNEQVSSNLELSFEKQTSPHQNCNLEPLNNENQIAINLECDLEPLNTTSNLEFSEYGLDFEKRINLDSDQDQTQSGFEKYMEDFLSEISPLPNDQLNKEIDSFEADIQTFIDQVSPKLQVHAIESAETAESVPETRHYFDLDLVKPEIDELDPLVIDESVCNDIRNETVPTQLAITGDLNDKTKSNNEIIFAEINVENVLSQTFDNKIYYKINSNICTLKNQILPNSNSLNYHNIINHSDTAYLHNTIDISNNVIDLTNNDIINKNSPNNNNNIRNLRKILPNNTLSNQELCHNNKPSCSLPNYQTKLLNNIRINSKTTETNTKNSQIELTNKQNTVNKSQINIKTSQSNTKNNLKTANENTPITDEQFIKLEPAQNLDGNSQIELLNSCNTINKIVTNNPDDNNVEIVQNNNENCSNLSNNVINDATTSKSSSENCEKTSQKTEKKSWKDGRKYHRCSICSRIVRHLTKHMRGHTENTSAMCEICGKILKNPRDFIKHQLAHKTKGAKEFKCNACTKSFFEFELLKKHREDHKTTRICPKCTKRILKSNLTHKCDRLPEKPKEVASVQQAKDVINCDKCDAKFTTVDTYNTHYLIHTTKQVSCTKCNLIFDSDELLIEHLKTHSESIIDQDISLDKQFTCEFCERKFTFHSQLIYHLKIHKTKKVNECKYCGEIFAKYYFFRNHKCKKFPDTTCPTCNKYFDCEIKLKKHFKIHIKKS